MGEVDESTTEGAPTSSDEDFTSSEAQPGDVRSFYNASRILDWVKGDQPSLRYSIGVGIEFIVYFCIALFLVGLALSGFEIVFGQLSTQVFGVISVKKVALLLISVVLMPGFNKVRPLAGYSD